MRALYGEHAIVAAYVQGLTGDDYGTPLASLGILNERGRLIGGFVFDRHTGPGIEMSLAGAGCVLRSAWQAVGDLVFRDLGCVRLVVTTRRSNKRVKRMAPRFGFKFEGIARRFYGEEDGIVYSLLKDEAVTKGLWKPEGQPPSFARQ